VQDRELRRRGEHRHQVHEVAVAEPPLGLRPLRETLITGYLAKLARESVRGGCSQERLARVMGVSPDTVAGWETGRRPLAAMRAGQFVRLKSQLARLDAEPLVVQLLGIALDADQILDHAMRKAGRHEPGDFHPLGARVHRREVIELAAWPLSGRTPAGLAAPPVRRGPVATMPELGPAARDAVFDHLRRVSEASGTDGLLCFRGRRVRSAH
jgi:transcriptional regulator with XRE-family HTH domain